MDTELANFFGGLVAWSVGVGLTFGSGRMAVRRFLPRRRAIETELALLRAGGYCPRMRILAALALLLQLQPLVGSALCIHDAAAKTECSMPSQGQLGTGTVSPPGAGSPSTCPGMGYCAPTAPGVPKLAEQLQITSFVHGAPALMALSLVSAEPGGPPFHPPKT